MSGLACKHKIELRLKIRRRTSSVNHEHLWSRSCEHKRGKNTGQEGGTSCPVLSKPFHTFRRVGHGVGQPPDPHRFGQKIRKIPEIIRFQGFSGAAGRIRTADLILTNCSKAPKVLLSSAFGAFLFQKCVVFGAFRSTVSIRSFSRVGHGVGQTVFRIQTRGAPLTAAGQAAAPCLVRR